MNDTACRQCRRRSWLLDRLSARLDYRSRDEHRLLEMLELPDEQLIEAAAGRKRGPLRDEWERFETDAGTADGCVEHMGHDGTGPEPDADGSGAEETETSKTTGNEAASESDIQTVCPHHTGYPGGLRERSGASRMLYVLGGGSERLASLMSKPAVAITGSVNPTDYGMEMARSLARGLSAAGVTIVGGFANGIATAAHAGALEGSGATVTVMAGGVDVVTPAGRRGLYARVIERGCAVSERPCGRPWRRWSELARARTIAEMTQLTIVVEAGASRAEMMPARVACRLGRSVAAVPGRVTSPVSVGTNLLLMAGAPLVRGPVDAIEALYGAVHPGREATRLARLATAEAPCPTARPHWPTVEALLTREGDASRTGGIEPRLRRVLERVGSGRDTPAKLIEDGQDAGEAMLALSELELAGLLGRGDGGRYVPRESLAG